MINVKIVDVLSGDDVDLIVPIRIKIKQLVELISLFLREIRKVLKYDVGLFQRITERKVRYDRACSSPSQTSIRVRGEAVLLQYRAELQVQRQFLHKKVH